MMEISGEMLLEDLTLKQTLEGVMKWWKLCAKVSSLWHSSSYDPVFTAPI